MPVATVGGGTDIRGEGEFRGNRCEKCDIPFVWNGGIRSCPECGGQVGFLIWKQATIPLPKMPDPPKVPKPDCRPCINRYVFDFERWSIKCQDLMKEHEKIMEYHAKRVAFAEKYRNAEIPGKYRTGNPSPTTGQEAKDEIKRLKNLEKEVKK